MTDIKHLTQGLSHLKHSVHDGSAPAPTPTSAEGSLADPHLYLPHPWS